MSHRTLANRRRAEPQRGNSSQRERRDVIGATELNNSSLIRLSTCAQRAATTTFAPQHCIRNHCDSTCASSPASCSAPREPDEMTGAICNPGTASARPTRRRRAGGARPELEGLDGPREARRGVRHDGPRLQDAGAHGARQDRVSRSARPRARPGRRGLENDCARVKTYADDSTRDVQTARLWLEGLGCVGNQVDVAATLPGSILSDDFVQPNGIMKWRRRARPGVDLEATWMR